MTRPIPAAWLPYLEDFTTTLRAGGHPETTISTRLAHLRRAARSLGASPPDITGDRLVSWCGRQSWSTETRRGYRSSLLAFFAWTHATGRTATNPALALPKISPAKPSPRPCPDSVYAEAVKRADQRGRLILRLAAEVGLRRAEIAVVHTRDLIDDINGYSLLVHGKGRKDRVVPLPDAIASEIRRAPTGWLFPGDDHGHLSPRWVGKLAADLLPGEWTIHKLRHRFATRAYRGTRNLRAVQQLLGHESVATTQIYTAVDTDEMRAAMHAAA